MLAYSPTSLISYASYQWLYLWRSVRKSGNTRFDQSLMVYGSDNLGNLV